ncbi:MAG TPA: phenylalanine--tRNA ligase subunit alpha, partial [Anaerolineae bacterium]|nr:phenylalanine--tRNA ligase subunit alpha [Anaerolineae bacterium]
MLERLDELERQALAALKRVKDEVGMNAWRVKYLGRSAELGTILTELRELPKEDRPAVGRRANEVKSHLEEIFQARADALRVEALERSLREERLDVTLPGRKPLLGRIHPANQTLRQIYAIWAEMGFQIYLSREVETDDY